MDASHESRNSISFRDRDIANIGGLEQGKIALLSILPRLQAPGADPVEAGSGFDTGEEIDDIFWLCTHGSASFCHVLLLDQRRIGPRPFCPAQCGCNRFGD